MYVAAFSWAFTTITTVGYGDIYPVSDPEKIVAMFNMVAACGVFAYIVGTVGSLFDRGDSMIQDFK